MRNPHPPSRSAGPAPGRRHPTTGAFRAALPGGARSIRARRPAAPLQPGPRGAEHATNHRRACRRVAQGIATPIGADEPSPEAAHRPWREKALSPGHLALPREAPRSRQLLATCQQPLRVAPSHPSGQREEMVAFDELMRHAGPGPPPLRSLSSCRLRKPKPRARAHRCWACRAPGGVCRSAWLRNIGREKTFLARSRGSSQERTVKPTGRTDEINRSVWCAFVCWCLRVQRLAAHASI